MKHIFNKRSFHFCLKSLSPFSNPNPNFILYNQQTPLLQSITPLISNPRCFNGVSHRTLSTRLSEHDIKPNNKTILLPGCDSVHWLVVVDQPDLNLTRDEIIDGYIKTLATILTSEEEARMKIYSVSTKHYFAFGALVSEELAYKLKELPHVRWVLPDSYLDVKNQTYAGEPFINGQAVPYDPKYHAIWLRNREESLKTNMRSKRKQSDPNSSRLRENSPTSVFQSHVPHSTQVQNHSMPSNQASISSQMPKQTPNQSLEPGSRCQNQPSEPQILKNGNLYNNLPLSSSGNSKPSYMGHSNFRGGDQHNHYENIQLDVPPNYHPDQSSWNYQKERLTPSPHVSDTLPSHDVNSGFQGRDMSSYNVNPSFQGQDIPSQYGNPGLYGQNMPHHIVKPGFQGRKMPSHNGNLGFQGQDMTSHSSNTGSQGRDMSSLSVNPGFLGQNMASSSLNSGLQSHNANPGFREREVSSHNVNQGFQEQDMTYPHQQSGYSCRGFSGDVQNGNYHDGYLSTLAQHRQSHNGYVELQSSNTTIPSRGAWGSENASMTHGAHARNMPYQMQKPPPQQHQSTYAEFQSANNYYNMNDPVQNSGFPNANMMPHVQNYYQGENMSQSIQNSEYQYDMRQGAKQVDNNNEGMLSGTLQPRDYQERDVPFDD